MKKKIIFFDGDGTLWYPKKTKYKEHPVWIWKRYKDIKRIRKELILIPTVLSTLKKLKKLGIKLVVLSTSPRPLQEADAIVHGNIKHFKLINLFDEIYSTRDYHGSKGKFMLKILKRRKIPKNKALMVGDSYNWDYKPARKVGIGALLIESEYMKRNPISKKIKKTIKKLGDILTYV